MLKESRKKAVLGRFENSRLWLRRLCNTACFMGYSLKSFTTFCIVHQWALEQKLVGPPNQSKAEFGFDTGRQKNMQRLCVGGRGVEDNCAGCNFWVYICVHLVGREPTTRIKNVCLEGGIA